uniref:Haem-binding uptake Tiki superfamily ChaN domain-containing protein n=1 Tax=Alexandrium monilatum TaxID=311494 RepID=A0A7S4VRY3_9DINO
MPPSGPMDCAGARAFLAAGLRLPREVAPASAAGCSACCRFALADGRRPHASRRPGPAACGWRLLGAGLLRSALARRGRRLRRLARAALPRRRLLGAVAPAAAIADPRLLTPVAWPGRSLWRVAATGDAEEVETGAIPDALLRGSDVVVLGEHHDRFDDHRMQADFVRAFASARGEQNTAVGLEMVEQPFQPALDRFNRGEISVADLYNETEWSKRWVWPFEGYAPIFEAARASGAPLVALNTAQETQRQVPLRGLAALSAQELAQYLPDKAGFAATMRLPGFLDYADSVVMASYSAHLQASWLGSQDSAKATPQNFLAARLLRDEAMAAAAWRWLTADGPGAGRSMVVLVGGDHVKFGYGMGQRLRRLGSPAERYRVAVTGLNVRKQPDPDAEVVTVLVAGEVVEASVESPAAADGGRPLYARLADGRGFALLQDAGGRPLLEHVAARPLRVSTVMLNPSPADSLSEQPSLRLALPLGGVPRENWPTLADYIWAEQPNKKRTLGVPA